MKRAPDSHKGENGVVAIIGGSRFMHGAPIFSALGAESTGIDLLHVCVPACHEEVTKAAGLNFQVHPFAGNDLRNADTEELLEQLASVDCAVIGPGIAHGDDAALHAITALLQGAACPMVLDAAALQANTLELVRGKPVVLTPHLGELERMNVAPESLPQIADKYDVTIFLKGATDHIADRNGNEHLIRGGNAGLTVGGTGDVLAGLIAGLLAQHMETTDACVLAGRLMKQAGDDLYAEKGYAYTAADVIHRIPTLLHTHAHA